MVVEIGALGTGEVPRCPENIQRRIKEFDRRLRVVFNVQEKVWQVQEFLEKQGTYSHVMFWHNGPWTAKEFKPLPPGAEPMIAMICKRDLVRHGRNLAQYAKDIDAKGASERAARANQTRLMLNDKLRRYYKWAYERAAILKRKYQRGGAARQDAIQERLDVLKDLGLRQN